MNEEKEILNKLTDEVLLNLFYVSKNEDYVKYYNELLRRLNNKKL